MRQAVATDLAAAQSVTASTNADAPRHDAQSAQDNNVRKIILDAHSREVIFQVVNAESGRVVRQVPDEAMLRLRAYTRAIAQGPHAERSRPGRHRSLIFPQNLMLKPAPRYNRGRCHHTPSR